MTQDTMFDYAIQILEDEQFVTSELISDPEDSSFNRSRWIHRHKSLKDTVSHLKLVKLGGFTALLNNIREWGVERNITGENRKATADTQFEKLLEEVEELREGLKDNDRSAIIDAIGDITVVLVLLSELCSMKFEHCVQSAYDEIKDRKGNMIDGQFVKN